MIFYRSKNAPAKVEPGLYQYIGLAVSTVFGRVQRNACGLEYQLGFVLDKVVGQRSR